MLMLLKQVSLVERVASSNTRNGFHSELAAEREQFFAELKHKHGVESFIPDLEQTLLDLHRLRGRPDTAAAREERSRLLRSGEDAFTWAADNKSVHVNTIVDSFRVFYLEAITDETSETGHIILGRIAFNIQFRLIMDYSSLSEENKKFNNTVLAQLAGEYTEFLQLLTVPSEAKEWARMQRFLNNNVSSDTINKYITRIIELSAEITDFIREKNIQEEKEIKLLERRREELAGFKLPPALRRAITDLLGLNPEDLDPAVARKAAEVAALEAG